MTAPVVRVGRRSFRLPTSRPLRIAIGVLFVIGGLLGFLPILGFWMIPVGLLVLSVDVARVRRWRRRLAVRWYRWRAASRGATRARPAAPNP